MTLPSLVLRLRKGAEKPVRKGCPWVFAGDLVESSEQLLVEPGILAELHSEKGKVMGIGYFHAKSNLAFRMLAPAPVEVNETFFEAKIKVALRLREQHYDAPFYRLVNSEGDGLPGLIIDRFGDICALQVATAGMERLLPDILAALDLAIAPRSIVLRNDFAARTLEGLTREVKVIRGEVPERIEVLENGCIYYADILGGQKTGWFYDQRDNRLLVAKAAADRTVLDLYCNAGGFGVLAAKNGARRVTMVDSSALALELAGEAVKRNNEGEICTLKRGDARATMDDLAAARAKYGIVIVDPPAFVKRKQDIAPGMAAYKALARQAAGLVDDAGLLFIASCSHHASRPRFRESVMAGIKEAGRIGRVLAYTGHAADHPVHPSLPQSEYLKALLVRCHNG